MQTVFSKKDFNVCIFTFYKFNVSDYNTQQHLFKNNILLLH